MLEMNEELKLKLKNCIKDKKLIRIYLTDLWMIKYAPRNEQVENILKIEKDKNIELSDELFIVEMIKKYFYPTLYKIINEYACVLSKDKFVKLKGLLNSENIIFEYNDKEHDISADTEKGVIKIHLNKNEKITIERLANILGTLPHEVFHFIFHFLKAPDEESARYFYELKTGEKLHFPPGKVGTILAEGFVEKQSIEFCKKNNFFYTINPHYFPYVELCNYLTRELHLDENFLLSSNYVDVFNFFSPEVLEQYLYYESISVIQNFNPIDDNKKEYKNISVQDLNKTWVEELILHNQKKI